MLHYPQKRFLCCRRPRKMKIRIQNVDQGGLAWPMRALHFYFKCLSNTALLFFVSGKHYCIIIVIIDVCICTFKKYILFSPSAQVQGRVSCSSPVSHEQLFSFLLLTFSPIITIRTKYEVHFYHTKCLDRIGWCERVRNEKKS